MGKEAVCLKINSETRTYEIQENLKFLVIMSLHGMVPNPILKLTSIRPVLHQNISATSTKSLLLVQLRATKLPQGVAGMRTLSRLDQAVLSDRRR